MKSYRLVLGSIIIGLLLTGVVYAAARIIPGFFPSDEGKVTIVGVKYLTKVAADGGSMEESDADKYRYAVVTFRIEKPAGKELTLAAADVTLHYERADGSYDIAPCEGLGGFTVNKDEDRTIQMPNFSGPGWVKIKTGSATRTAATVYADAVFGKIEPSVSALWLGIAQPASSQFATKGWKP
jgi:hypothetical protein